MTARLVPDLPDADRRPDRGAVSRPVLCWLAYYDDASGFVVFRSEVAALRYAVGRSGMQAP